MEPGLVIVDWLPDGEGAGASRSTAAGLAVVDSTGRTVRALPFADSLTVFSGLSLSPDGAEVALAMSGPATTRVYALALADGALRRIADIAALPGVHLLLQRWATDGYLYFSRVVGVAPRRSCGASRSGAARCEHAAALPVACSQGTISLSRDAQHGACLVYDDRPDLWLVERRELIKKRAGGGW